MSTTIRKFERNRYIANAYCPCGRSNRSGKFATEKGFAGLPVGHCFSCDKDYWNENTNIQVSTSDRQTVEINYCNHYWEEMSKTFDANLESSFAKYLVKMFGEDEAAEVVERYLLGNIKGDVIFWQVDREDNVRAGKVIAYDTNGKRKKYSNSGNLWMHKKGECQLRQCFFGDHLIPDNDKPIAIVESAKSACIMSIKNPDYIWLSAESLGGLSLEKCESVKEFDVTLYPDQGAYDQWNEKAKAYDFQISKYCEFWYKAGIIKAKDDIADYYLTKHSLSDYEVVKYDPDWESFVKDNPHLNLEL